MKKKLIIVLVVFAVLDEVNDNAKYIMDWGIK